MLKKCLLCGGELIDVKEDISEKVLGYSFLFKNVPVSKCLKCGEIHFSGPVNDFIENHISSKIKQEEKLTFDFNELNKNNEAATSEACL